MTLEQFYKVLETDMKKNGLSDKIVRLKTKYRHEHNYHYSNELLIVDTDSKNFYSWLYDWDEGQEDVIILEWMNISDIVWMYQVTGNKA